MTKPQVLWQCRWNCECAEKGLLEESGACGLKDLPKEVLTKIAECLDLATQVNLWETNKHLCEMLNGKVQFVKDFDSTACSVPLDYRCNAEAFALCGIELLSNLPSVAHIEGLVEVVYTDMRSLVDTVNIRYLEALIIPGIPDAPMFRVEYSHRDADEEDSDGGYEMSGFRNTCEKCWVHKLLCSAPDPDSIYEVRQIASRVILQSSLVTGGLEHLRQCAQYCYDLMCSRRWCSSVLYIIFSPPSPDFDGGCHALKIGRSIVSSQNDLWSLNNRDCRSSPFKLDFTCFPQRALQVQAYFSFECVESLPEYLIGTDLVQQQCMGFCV